MILDFAYFLKVNIAFMLFYAFYRLLFYRDTFFKLRRAILLTFFAVSLLYPLLDIQEWLRGQDSFVEFAELYTLIVSEISVLPAQGMPDFQINRCLVALLGLYGGGILLLLVRFFIQLSCIIGLACRSKVVSYQGISLHLLQKPTGPFSFFKWIFLYPQSHTEKEVDEILTHELAHVKQWHSLDVLLSEILSILFWINPFVWLLKREVRYNLEYLADDRVLKSGYDSRSYQYHLLGLAHTDLSATALSNKFNMLHLKNRIGMMNKRRSRSICRMKYLLLIPIVALLLLINNVDHVSHFIQRWSSVGGQRERSVDFKWPFPTLASLVPIEESAPYRLIVHSPQNRSQAVFTVVEKMPEFPGGTSALLHFLASRIKYPTLAQENGIQGRVACSFVVYPDGRLGDIQIVRGIDPSLDQEAVRVISLMPKWTPGEQNGNPVAVKFTVPITFRLA